MERVTYTSGSTAALDAAFEEELARIREQETPVLTHRIGDDRVAAGPVFERLDPARTGSTASRAHAADAAVVAEAVRLARRASVSWGALTHEERAERLLCVPEALAPRVVEIAAVISRETGKSRVEAVAEVQEAMDIFRVYADVGRRSDGYVFPMRDASPRERNVSVFRPYGVFGVISPFNFPVALVANMVAAALFGGNAVVLKPSEEAPWSAELLAAALEAADLPTGTVNVVHGSSDTGKALVDSAVDGIAFTGSAAVGQSIVQRLATGPFVRPALTELGGKNPTIVTASADVEAAAEGVARSAFGLSGQKCSACSRVAVVASAHDAFVDALVSFTEGLSVGDPLDRRTFLGPVVNERSVARYDRAVSIAREEGAVLTGGRHVDGPGHFVAPTVVGGLARGHELTREELFVPLVTVTPVTDLDDALEEANAGRYGLSAGIFTEDEAERQTFLDRMLAGVLYVNHRSGATTGAWPGMQSFCGWRASGSSGKGGLGLHYVSQFMREQSHTIVG